MAGFPQGTPAYNPAVLDRSTWLKLLREQPWALAIAIVGLLFVLVATRPYDGALFHHARAGSDWSHHYIRVQMATGLKAIGLLDIPSWVVDGDHDFPPLIHVIGAPLGYLVGHDEVAIQRAGLIWVLLLGLSVGWVSRRLTGDRIVGLATGVAVTALPAAHAASLNYYFDLPMTALLWLMVALLLATQDRSPLLAGVLGGSACFLAALAKWTALPMAPPMILGALACRPRGLQWNQIVFGRRVVSAGALTATLALLLVQFWQLSSRSWERMLQMTYGGRLGPPPDPSAGPADGILRDLTARLPDVVDLLGHLDLESFFFYPVRLCFCVFSPLLTAMILWGIVLWVRRSTVGWPLVGAIVGGHILLLYFVIPDLDDRFLLTLSPALVLAAVLGWRTLLPPMRNAVAAVYVLLALWVAWDFHHSSVDPDEDPGIGDSVSTGLSPLREAIDADVLSRLQGIGLQSGVDRQWGWVRADDPTPSYFPLRQTLWNEAIRCGAEVLLVEDFLTPDGFGGLWWSYRNDLARLEGEPGFWSIQGFENELSSIYSGETVPLEDAIERDLVIALSRNDLSQPEVPPPTPPLLRNRWQIRAIADRGEASGASHLALWAPRGSQLCSQWTEGRGELGPPADD